MPEYTQGMSIRYKDMFGIITNIRDEIQTRIESTDENYISIQYTVIPENPIDYILGIVVNLETEDELIAVGCIPVYFKNINECKNHIRKHIKPRIENINLQNDNYDFEDEYY